MSSSYKVVAARPVLWLLRAVRGSPSVDVGSTFVGNLAGAAAAFSAGIVLAHWLGPALRGTFELGLFSTNLAVLVLSLGLNIPTSVFARREPARGIWAYRSGLSVTLVIVLGAGILISAIPAPVWPAAWRGQRTLATAALAAFSSLCLLQLLSGLLLGYGKVHWMNLAVAVRWLSYLALLLVLSSWTAPAADGALASFAAAALVGAAVALRGLRGIDRSRQTAGPARTSWRDIVWFGLKAQISNILQFASYRFDVIIVSFFVGAANLGVYAVGVMFAEALWLLPNAIGTILLSHTSRSTRSAADERIKIVFPAGMALVIVGALLISAGTPIVARMYLGPAYTKVPMVTWLLMPGAVALSAGKILANELTARGFPGANAVAAAWGSATTLVADLLLIPTFGIYGASVASSLGYCLTSAFVIVAFCRRSGVPVLALTGRT